MELKEQPTHEQEVLLREEILNIPPQLITEPALNIIDHERRIPPKSAHRRASEVAG